MTQEIIANVETMEVFKKVIKEQSSDGDITKAQISSTVQQFISSASLIFALGHSSELSTETDFVERFLYYLSATILSTAIQIYISYHLLTNKKLIARAAFDAILIITQLICNYFTFLLVGLIRDQLSSAVSQEYWQNIHLASLVIIVLLYYVLSSVGNYLLNKYIQKSKNCNDEGL